MDLYQEKLTSPFVKACGGSNNEDGEGESCAMVSPMNDHAFALRDSKNPAAGELRFDRSEKDALIKALQAL